jgi:hypothetical protein
VISWYDFEMVPVAPIITGLLLLLLLFTAIYFSLGDSSPCNSPDKNKYTRIQYKNTDKEIKNTVNTSRLHILPKHPHNCH